MFGAPLGPVATVCSPDDSGNVGMPDFSIVGWSAITCELAGNPTITFGFWSIACSNAVWAASGVSGAAMREYSTLLPSSSAAIPMPSA